MSSSSERDFGSVRLSESIAGPEDIVDIVKAYDAIPKAEDSLSNDVMQLTEHQPGYVVGRFYKFISNTWVDVSDVEAPTVSQAASGQIQLSANGLMTRGLIKLSDAVSSEYLHSELVLCLVENGEINGETVLLKYSTRNRFNSSSPSHPLTLSFPFDYFSDPKVKFYLKTSFRNGSFTYTEVSKSLIS